jgi:hypothetical protein
LGANSSPSCCFFPRYSIIPTLSAALPLVSRPIFHVIQQAHRGFREHVDLGLGQQPPRVFSGLGCEEKLWRLMARRPCWKVLRVGEVNNWGGGLIPRRACFVARYLCPLFPVHTHALAMSTNKLSLDFLLNSESSEHQNPTRQPPVDARPALLSMSLPKSIQVSFLLSNTSRTFRRHLHPHPLHL